MLLKAMIIGLMVTIAIFGVIWPMVRYCLYLIFGDYDDEES